MLFLLTLRSRRQFRFESKTPAFIANLNLLAGVSIETAPHDDTIVYYVERIAPKHTELLPVKIVQRLIRMKALDRWRLHGGFLVAIDATGQFFFRQRHCPYCLSREGPDGKTFFFHHVLEAKLLTASGLAFSVATEFIENQNPNADTQDCELNAFPRLASKLKAFFPHLPIILLADSLYACKSVFDICQQNHWRFIFTLKEGSMPALFKEFEILRDLSPENRSSHQLDNLHQEFSWVNHLDHEGHILSVLDCLEQNPNGEKRYFAWITNIQVGSASAITLANQGGRLRWKIENEGFNIQKNHGYELEHPYSTHPWASKHFYFFLQVAHAVNQLITHGSLLPNFYKLLGSLKNFLRRLAEDLRLKPISPQSFNQQQLFQIRLDSS